MRAELTRGAKQFAVGWLSRAQHFLPPLTPPDLSPEVVETIHRVRPYTMTTVPRVAALCESVEYVVRHGIPGAIAECGVWRGGSMMAVAHTLLRVGAADRDLYLFDTFRGMPAPTAEDTRSAYDGYSPVRRWRRGRQEDGNAWHYVAAEEVRRNLVSTGYDPARLHIVEGKVEDTLPERAPAELALLRLDTDWYASTRHELEQLYSRLAPGGVLIVDDYGHYEGARRAVDEFFELSGERALLHRVDYTGRVAIRQSPVEGISHA